ncbi:hypothetical protein CI109_101342 [Kwoniella shandongensis]|uniref:Endonuclease III homolog n=1 Tax=Kwoniella shandongensis TaxID=1734106 RepID=A0A5M6BUC0_9TREE|nr:uncharacterized protein CI109_005279 [Kwoniella shandongensis]KAA5526323.1 hypothetical protein CI109_005279 [Kwoniella shandongensis]
MASIPLRSKRSFPSRVPTTVSDPSAPLNKTEPPMIASTSTSTLADTSNTTKSPFVSLRRTTRRVAAPTPVSPIRGTTKLGIEKYRFGAPSTPSPRKKPRLDIKAEAEEDVEDLVKVEDAATPKTPRSASKKPLPQVALAKPHPAPAKWEEQYRLIERMRKGIVAPVDDMGCERPRTIVDNDPKTLRFHMLISLMLSSQTKDPVTSAAVTTLHDTLPGGLTAQSLADASLETVQNCINKVGFWRRKADYIQEAARKLLEREGEEKGDVPNTIEGLCELKGVGPKMGFLALQCAWNINAGIGVDVHVHRITNRLKWHKPPTQTPEQTRLNLQSWLPPHLHKPINPLLVGFGQVICLPVGPRCDVCLLGKRKICPARVAGVKSVGRKEVIYTFTEEDEGDGDVGQGVAKVEVGYEPEGSLEKIKDEVDVLIQPVPIKMEREHDLEQEVEKPGMTTVEEVLEVLDEVDGVADIDEPVVVKREM